MKRPTEKSRPVKLFCRCSACVESTLGEGTPSPCENLSSTDRVKLAGSVISKSLQNIETSMNARIRRTKDQGGNKMKTVTDLFWIDEEHELTRAPADVLITLGVLKTAGKHVAEIIDVAFDGKTIYRMATQEEIMAYACTMIEHVEAECPHQCTSEPVCLCNFPLGTIDIRPRDGFGLMIPINKLSPLAQEEANHVLS